MILQRIRIIVGGAGSEPGTSAPEVWCATYEPPPDLWYGYLCVSVTVRLTSLPAATWLSPG